MMKRPSQTDLAPIFRGGAILGGEKISAPPAAGMWTRTDGRQVQMSAMNPYHRAAAAKKADAAGDHATAEALHASGPLPEA